MGVENEEENKHDEKPAEISANGEKEGNSKKKEKSETVPFHRLFTFADSTDTLLMFVGTIGAVGNGMGLPLMTLLFGQLINGFGNNQGSSDVVEEVSKVNSRMD